MRRFRRLRWVLAGVAAVGGAAATLVYAAGRGERQVARLVADLDAADGPPPGEVVAALAAALPASDRPYLAETGPTHLLAVQNALDTQSLMTAAAVAVAVERYRLRTGSWPATLATVPADLLPRVPADPATGGPVSYKRLADGVVVYCVGAHGVDNGGYVWPPIWFPEKDFGLRLWDTD